MSKSLLSNSKASVSLFLISILPLLLLIGATCVSHINIIRNKSKLEHLCYTKHLRAQSYIANFLNYITRDHNPLAKSYDKKKRVLIELKRLNINPVVEASLAAAIGNIELLQKQLKWKTKSKKVLALLKRNKTFNELIQVFDKNQIVKQKPEKHFSFNFIEKKLDINSLFYIKNSTPMYSMKTLTIKNYKNLLISTEYSGALKTRTNFLTKISCASHIIKRRNRWVANLKEVQF